MNNKTNIKASEIKINELQKIVLNSPSLKKYHQESEILISNLQLASSLERS